MKRNEIGLDEIKKRIFPFAIDLLLIGVAMFLGWDRLFTVPGILFCLAIVILFFIGVGDIVSLVMLIMTGKDELRVVRPITSTAVAVISFVVGIIMYVTDDSLALRGLEAELVWFVISIPAMVTAFIQMFIYTLKKEPGNKETEG